MYIENAQNVILCIIQLEQNVYTMHSFESFWIIRLDVVFSTYIE